MREADRRDHRAEDYRAPRFRLGLAWAALGWEELWPRLAPLIGVVGIFAALVLFDLLPWLPGWLHLGLLGVLAALAIAATVWGLRGIAAPTRAAARRRIERDSNLPHRPLSTLIDKQIAGRADPASRAIWALHQERQAAAARRLRLRPPHPHLGERDGFALRGLLALLLVIGVIGAWRDWDERLGRALTPQMAAQAAAPLSALDVIITPPAYTAVAPIFLNPAMIQAAATPDGAPAPRPMIRVPVNSTVLARVTGGVEPPVLQLGAEQTAFTPLGGQSFEVERQIVPAEQLVVTQAGAELGNWPITIIPDLPPTAALAEEPAPSERFALRLAYQTADDYGVTSLAAEFTLPPDAPAALGTAPMVLNLVLPGRSPRQADGVGYHDLTPHPWAGQTVTLQLRALDGAGQPGLSEPVELVLPEREFTHPVAQAIIQARKELLWDPNTAIVVAETLETLSSRPDRFYDDSVVFLALRMAARRLFLADDAETEVAPVQQLLWDTALRIEDGNLSLAERSLREAEQRLMDALANEDTTDAELQQLMADLERALNDYLKALEQQLAERMANGEQMPEMQMPPGAELMDRNQLQEMLEQMQDLAQSGAREQAMEMLQRLQEMMENLQAGVMSPDQMQRQSEAMQMLEDLQQLMQAQRELLDQTFQDAQRQGQNGQPQQPGQQPGQQGQPQPGQRPGQPGEQGQPMDGAAIQEALRRMLGELMRQMGEMAGDIPGQMGEAEQAMRRSEQALGQGQPGQAVEPQTEALNQLQQGLESLVDQMMQQMAGQNGGMQVMPGQQPMEAGRDPLGRPLPNAGGMSTRDVEIPEEADIQRARQILDELRRRFGQRSRPLLERDYIERLLRRF